MKKQFIFFIPFLIFSFRGICQRTAEARFTPPVCYCVPVAIVNQPISSTFGCINNSVHQFTVGVTGTGPFTYQWKENNINIVDSVNYTGSSTATLIITNPAFNLNGKRYRCVVTNCNGTAVITDNNAIINVKSLESDINKDGVTDNFDMLLLSQNFNSSCSPCASDINADGVIDNFDFLKLLGQFYQTCF